MSAEDWKDLLDGFAYSFAQPIYYALVFYMVLMILAPILNFAMDYLTSRKKDD
jgi:hypothetical protein